VDERHQEDKSHGDVCRRSGGVIAPSIVDVMTAQTGDDATRWTIHQERVIDDTPRPIAQVNQEIPGWLCDLIARLRKHPLARAIVEFAEDGRVSRVTMFYDSTPD
jgi:hypothetical protein